MTHEEKQEIIAIIKDTIKSELGIQISLMELKNIVIRQYKQTEAQRPFLCSDAKCKNRKSCKVNV